MNELKRELTVLTDGDSFHPEARLSLSDKQMALKEKKRIGADLVAQGEGH